MFLIRCLSICCCAYVYLMPATCALIPVDHRHAFMEVNTSHHIGGKGGRCFLDACIEIYSYAMESPPYSSPPSNETMEMQRKREGKQTEWHCKVKSWKPYWHNEISNPTGQAFNKAATSFQLLHNYLACLQRVAEACYSRLDFHSAHTIAIRRWRGMDCIGIEVGKLGASHSGTTHFMGGINIFFHSLFHLFPHLLHMI